MSGELYLAVVRKLDVREPQVGQLRRAAVSVILRNRDAPSVLLIKRADRAGDPWSGQVAFPGGKSQEGDSTVKDTAIREAEEEVGLDLRTGAEFLGYFAPFRTHTGTMDVIPSVFLLKSDGEVRTNEEVASYRWVNLQTLLSNRTRSAYRLEVGGQAREMPALLIEDFVIWGLTHRIISELLG